jgi:hypothetical protein
MASGWYDFFQEIENFFKEIERSSCDFLPIFESLLCRLEYAANNVLDIRERILAVVASNSAADDYNCHLDLINHLDSLLLCIITDVKVLKEKCELLSTEELPAEGVLSTSLIFIRNGSRGRPKIDVNIDQVCTLKEMGFSWVSIAKFIGVSRTTLYKKCDEANILTTYRCDPTNPTNAEIDEVLIKFKSDFPNAGERMIIGHFRSLGICVTRDRIRNSIHKLDPLNTSLRWNAKIHRHSYSVAGPNSLWHIGI